MAAVMSGLTCKKEKSRVWVYGGNGSNLFLTFLISGNKLIGVQKLQAYLNAKPEETLHVGDQFLSTGNDYAARTSWYVTIWKP
jgi:hydroxymethylpyrimidine pyrophosphatase-like HAD family hydrolase